jgi:hypothetical protein
MALKNSRVIGLTMTVGRSSALLLAGLACCLWAGEIEAGAATQIVRWDQEKIAATISDVEKSFHATFPFQNVSNGPITIIAVNASCGCTTAKLSKYTYNKLERGKIEVDVDTETRVGHQRITLSVGIKELSAPVMLELELEISPPVSAQPSLIFWKLDSKPDPRIVEISINRDRQILIQDVKSDNANFLTTLTREQSNGAIRYKLQIAPVSTQREARGLIKITTLPAIKNSPSVFVVIE